MFCSKCGSKIEDNAKFCPDCGNELTTNVPSKEATVVVVKEKGGCFKGCLVSVISVAVVGFLSVLMIGYVASEDEKKDQAIMANSSSVSLEEAVKNGEDLVAWIRSKEKLTDLSRDDAFARIKGKTVILKGKVREVGKTAFSEEVYVSLTVGQLNAFENINVQFNVRKSLAEKVKSWNKDEIHTLRGRIVEQGDLVDDAKCDIAEIVE